MAKNTNKNKAAAKPAAAPPVNNSNKPKEKGKNKKKDKADAAASSAPETIAKDRADAREQALGAYGEGSLGRVAAPASIAYRNPTVQVQQIGREAAGAGQTIAQAESAYNQAMIQDPYVQAALQKSMAQTDGINAAENQALKESARRSIRSDAATSLRQLRAYQGSAGVTGDSAGNQARRLMTDTNTILGNQATDLAAKNVEFKQNAIQNFGNLANTSNVNFANIKNQALTTLADARQYGSDYNLSADKANQGADSTNQANQATYDKGNIEIDQSNIVNARNNALDNLDKLEKEKLGYLDVYYGEQGLSAARRGDDKAAAQANEYMKIAKQGM